MTYKSFRLNIVYIIKFLLHVSDFFYSFFSLHLLIELVSQVVYIHKNVFSVLSTSNSNFFEIDVEYKHSKFKLVSFLALPFKHSFNQQIFSYSVKFYNCVVDLYFINKFGYFLRSPVNISHFLSIACLIND